MAATTQPAQTAKPDISIVIDGTEIKAKHRVFSSGKEGYGSYGIIKIKGYPHRISINLIEVA